MTSATPLNTPPATDRGLSEEDFALMKRVLGSGRQWPLNPRELSALLAAARREGEGGIASRDHDHSTDTSGADRAGVQS